MHGQRPDNGDALLLSARELRGVGGGFVLQTDPLQKRHGFILCLGLGL